jgi:hypothetical protein
MTVTGEVVLVGSATLTASEAFITGFDTFTN